MRKKKILIHSNSCKAFTGFGKHKKNLLKHLYSTGKYEIVELCNAMHRDDPKLQLLPWKAIGTLPTDPVAIREAQKSPEAKRDMGYGHGAIDDIVFSEKPDIYLGIEDVWAFNGFPQKDWWDKINSIIHTTLDSLPILPDAFKIASLTKHFYVWASFAEKAMAKKELKNVKTIRGIVDSEHFYKLGEKQRENLRKKFKINDSFLVGFVFRNQLRKSAPNLLDGFKQFKNKNPQSKAKLLLHTHWSEGWNIPSLITEKGINIKDVLTTYFCKSCKDYLVHSFIGQNIDCPYCGGKNTVETTNISNGVSEEQLNEVYNLMDVYCHPFTSGGQEIPVQEAKLTELITLVTNYSCGEDHCTEESGGLPLEWNENTEIGTQFIKAVTSPFSIAKQLEKVYKFSPEKRKQIGKKARQFIMENYSVEVVGRQFEKLFDEMPFINWEEKKIEKFLKRNPSYIPAETNDNVVWLTDLYNGALKMKANKYDDGLKFWVSEMKKGKSRQEVLDYFKKTAAKENTDNAKKTLKQWVDKDRKNKRIAFVMPHHAEDVFMSTATVNSLKEKYPQHDIYFFTKRMYYDLVDNCENIHKICEYSEGMDFDCFSFIGRADKEGLFDLAFFPHKETKNSYDYMNHGRTES